MSEKCILYISSTNYKIVSAGTEKFMGSIINSYQKEGIHSIQVFPLIGLNKKIENWGFPRNYIGLNFDGHFIGAYYLTDILGALGYLSKKYDLQYNGIIINQLYGWELMGLSQSLLALALPIYIVIHDYMMICPYYMLQDGDGIKCGLSIKQPESNRCSKCKYCADGIAHFKTITKFFAEIHPLIKKIIFPSVSAKNNWLSVFPDFNDINLVRPHLNYFCVREKRIIAKKIRIGYLGFISDFKGYQEWKELIQKLDKTKFDFFYFGNYIKQAELDGAKGVLVDFNKTDLPRMVEQLKKYQIDIAFLWSNCQETYSYTYYEAFEAGCWIVTSKHSGNITSQVNYNNNGLAFETINDCINYLSNLPLELATAKAIGVEENTDFSMFLFPNIENKYIGMTQKPRTFISILYRKYRSINIEH